MRARYTFGRLKTPNARASFYGRFVCSDRSYLALSIWIETPCEERLQRGLERDGETARTQWEEWMAREDEYIEREHPEQEAHLVINGTELYDL